MCNINKTNKNHFAVQASLSIINTCKYQRKISIQVNLSMQIKYHNRCQKSNRHAYHKFASYTTNLSNVKFQSTIIFLNASIK